MQEEGIDEHRRHFLATITAFMAGLGIAVSGIPLFSSWLPSAKAQAAGGPVEVDISSLQPGQLMIVEWRGKPIWILRRTKEMLDSLAKNQDELRDPDSLVEQQPVYAHNRYRSINPEFLVLIGICTHLGCSPTFRPDLGGLGPKWQGGFYCPCHGSKFDLAGRVMKGVPAPINLEVPPYKFLNRATILIGEDQSGVSNG
jgi:ubiquinol-cytochrome c reductase iron-sulfur subunit